MRSNYKKLGDFITKVDVRNKNLQTENLQGLSMSKEFRKSTSNIVGTNLKKYKIVGKNQFACDFMSVIRVHKLPVVLHSSEELIIVSPAYTVFKITDETLLNPEYLMMWFRRPEFDRYADFKCDSAIRGGFKWDELCETELPVPSIEKQREIVAEYNVVKNRIKLNEQLNQKLEETAQALYKHWFMDFEFPNEDGKPYKSSGGAMVYNEELDKEIPEGWEVKNLETLIEIINGYAFKGNTLSNDGINPIVKIKNVMPPYINIDDVQYFNGEVNNRIKKVIISKGDILITMTGSGSNQMNSAVGQVGRYYNDENAFLNQRVAKLQPINEVYLDYIFQFISDERIHLELLNGSTGSANQANISPSQIKNIKILSPNNSVLFHYQKLNEIINNAKRFKSQNILKQLEILLLSKITRIKEEKELA